MKRKFLILLSALSLLTLPACGASKPDTESIPTQAESLPEEKEPFINETKQLDSNEKTDTENNSGELSEYSNDYISFSYNSDTLLVAELEDMTVIGDITGDPSSYKNKIMILNAKFPSPIDAASLKKSGLISVDVFFDKLFAVNDSVSSSFINVNDGYGEYQCLNNSGEFCRGKFFSVENDKGCYVLSLISCDPSSELYSSLDECFSSIEYLGENAWTYTDFDKMEELNEQSEKAASDSEIIKNGDIYNSIYEITNSFELTYFPYNNTYSVVLYADDGSVETISSEFISLSEKIYSESLLSDYSIVFTLGTNGQTIATFTVIANNSSEPVVYDKEYENAIITEYNNNELFSKIDITKQFENELDNISNKYQNEPLLLTAVNGYRFKNSVDDVRLDFEEIYLISSWNNIQPHNDSFLIMKVKASSDTPDDDGIYHFPDTIVGANGTKYESINYNFKYDYKDETGNTIDT